MKETLQIQNVNSLKDLIEYQIIRGELPTFLRGKNIHYHHWNKLEKIIKSLIDHENLRFNFTTDVKTLEHFIKRYQKQGKFNFIRPYALVLYQEHTPDKPSLKVDLVDITPPYSHPVKNYKKITGQFALKRLPLIIVDKNGYRLRKTDSAGVATYSGSKTRVIPLI